MNNYYMNKLILVNKNNKLDKDYIVNDLVSVGKQYDSINNCFSDIDILLVKEAANYFIEMIDDVNNKYSDVRVIADSGYRSYYDQERVLNYYIERDGESLAYDRVAVPGTSEHQTGLAIDIAIIKDGIYIDDVNDNDDVIKFLHNNCYRYGYILRFPKDCREITGFDYEPWHFRYVGIENAKEIYYRKLTLENYLNKL